MCQAFLHNRRITFSFTNVYVRCDDTFEAVSDGALRALIKPNQKTTSSSTERTCCFGHTTLCRGSNFAAVVQLPWRAVGRLLSRTNLPDDVTGQAPCLAAALCSM